MSAHTPGPWTTVGQVVKADGVNIAHVTQMMGDSPEVCAANAFLIAAAPDLLIALAEAVGAIRACAQQLAADFPKTSASLDEKAREFMALLAKAAPK